MFPNRFAIVLFIRVVLISLACLAFITLLTQTEKPATTLFLFIILVYLTGSLVTYVNRTNRELANFIIGIKENDTSVALSEEKLEKTFKGLSDTFKDVKAHFHKQYIENQEKQLFFKSIVDNSAVGLISFDPSGKIEICNSAAEELLDTSELTNIKKLNSIYPALGDNMLRMKPGEQSLFKLPQRTGDLHLSVKASLIRLRINSYTILSIQNIREALEDKEIESWKKLIRVFTHEIMNSITPITTLTTTIKRRFLLDGIRKSPTELSESDINDVFESTDIIEERSHGLISFVERYRSLTRLPDAKFTYFEATELLQQIERLYSEQFKIHHIDFKSIINPGNLKLFADQKLIEQVLINLLKNSMDALNGNESGKISLEVCQERNKSIIQVKDDGCGIPDDIRENIFMPFFSGKEGGSGIGLSLSKQIIRMHKGTIIASSGPEWKTIFTIELPMG